MKGWEILSAAASSGSDEGKHCKEMLDVMGSKLTNPMKKNCQKKGKLFFQIMVWPLTVQKKLENI